MRSRAFALALGVLFFPGVAFAGMPSLVVGVGDNMAEPFVLRDRGEVTGGIAKDFFDALGKRLGVEMVYISIPRKRHEEMLCSGMIHVLPLANPSWLHIPPGCWWSEPLVEDADVFVVSCRNVFPVRNLGDLEGKHLGAILGYSYGGGLTESCDRGRILREDVRQVEQNFRKLEAGRIDVLVDSEILVMYWLKQHAAQDAFDLAPFVLERHTRSAVFSPHAPVSREAVEAALRALREEGVLDAILESYR